MEIIDNRALLMKVRNPKAVTTVIPKSKQTGPDEVLVHWGVDEVHALRDLQIKAPAPISARYDWPGQYKPMSHQRTTAEFLTMNKRAFCFNEQGTGKTASAIWAADFLMKQKKVRRALVVCPLSIMDSAWRADLFKFAMHRTVDIAYGSAAKRKKIINGHAEFIIINYDGIGIVEKEIAEGGFDLIIIDEASHYKNAQSQRWKTLNRLLTPDTWLWMMTGTPAAQSPTDAYGLAKLVNPTNVPRYFNSFRDMVQVKLTQFKWGNKPDAVATVHRVLQPAIRFSKEECLDLPDMLYTKRHVPMTKQQDVYYKKLAKDMLLEFSDGSEVTAINAAIKMSKLLQISAGAVYTTEGDTLEFDISERYKVLREVIDESSKKVLVFVPFKSTIRMLTDRLVSDGISTEIISGDVNAGTRTDVFKRFQTEANPRVLVIQPQSAAHGVTLTAANTIVWWAPTASLETYAQANARIHRSGQTSKCTVVQLESSPVERRMYSMLDDRIDVHAQVLDLYKDLLD
jgi:SNF2 family DNA or RNA helicase